MTKNYFWDSNIFIAHLNQENAYREYLEIIKTILEDKDSMVFTSSLVFAEATPKKLEQSEWDSFRDFFNSFRQLITLINPSPEIWIKAGQLKDFPYKKNNSSGRILSTGDAIMLATALEFEPTYNDKLAAFHTFDDGKGRNSERKGKCIPILSYQEWVQDDDNPPDLVKDVIAMNRCTPSLYTNSLFD
ncbi:MAG: PIN domain-containing protein [Paracoccaceae bacterium]|nr:PIN domain-containing protein [Paracoccaceae bacterium]MDE2917389.1 PIN domain-containing protein [Paracoccaceae bacterium]